MFFFHYSEGENYQALRFQNKTICTLVILRISIEQEIKINNKRKCAHKDHILMNIISH